MAPRNAAQVKPNLFIVGAPKCGTTAWVRYLGDHPDVFFPAVKEPHYFCTDFPDWRGYSNEADYLSLFASAGDARVVGEASVRYLHSTEAAQNISKFDPNAKILIFVRDQRDYLPSQHNQMLFNKDECIADFETAWRLSGKRSPSDTSPLCREPKFLDYASAGEFSRHVERYFDAFPAEQIRVFHFDDWSRDPRKTYLEVLRFLGLPDDGRVDFPKVNEAAQRRTNWLWKLQRDPPRAARTIVQFVKRVTGLHTLGLAKAVSRLDSRKASVSRPNEALRNEIAAYYAADNARLEKRIWRPEASRC